MIRQSISCNMCGVQKREANHWFIAYEDAKELRITGWASPRRLSAGTVHLCGERCVHRLLSNFVAHTPEVPMQQAEHSEHKQRVEFIAPDGSTGPLAPRQRLSSASSGMAQDKTRGSEEYGFRRAKEAGLNLRLI